MEVDWKCRARHMLENHGSEWGRMTDVAKEVQAVALEAEATADDPMPTKVLPTKPNKSVPVAVRLAPEDAAAIDDLAASMNLPSSALMRGWILQGLAASREESLNSAIERIAADVQRLREIVA